MLEGEEMNREKLIAILLFLLLLLILLCTWCHSDDIAKKRALSASSHVNVETTAVVKQAINFNLVKDKNQIELSGNFVHKGNVEKLRTALNTNDLTDLSKIDKQLIEKNDAIALSEKLIPIFQSKYINGSINYQKNKLTVNGTVHNSIDKNEMSTLLANSTISSINNTTIITLPKDPIKFKIDKQNELLALQGLFASSTDADNLLNALDSSDLKKHIEIDNKRMSNPEILALTVKLIQPFKSLYQEGFIQYDNKILTIKGTVSNEAAKNTMETLLNESGVAYENNTQIVSSEPNAEKEATAEQAEKEVIEIEAEIKKVIDVEDINFDLNKATLTEKSLVTISHIASILQDHPTVHVEISGHTDSSGKDTYNLTLSQSRVDTIKAQLIKIGIDGSRLKAIGYGETKPLVSNDTEENKRLNRRVEFKIIGE